MAALGRIAQGGADAAPAEGWTNMPSPVDVVVIGLGYVGLPLAKRAVEVGLRVVGLDLNRDVVATLKSGRSHIDDIDDAGVRDMLARGFDATDDSAVLGAAAVAVICVPTPLSADGGPDLSAVLAAATAVSSELHSGMLVILESTTYPGTTEEVLLPILEASGGRVGEDFFLAFSPERIDPGNLEYSFQNTPKVVGGCTESCTMQASAFYGKLVREVVLARGTREAEMSKLMENTYRHVNIALVNEMVKFCNDLGIDLWDVIRCASTKPFGFQAFRPGPGVGGHCIPIDPNYLSHNVRSKLGYQFRFVELAQEINAGMPAYVLRRMQDLLNVNQLALNGSRVLLLGVTYKADISDLRESPARPLAEALRRSGAEVMYHDPYVDEWHLENLTLNSVPNLDAAISAADVTVLVQAHRIYIGLASLGSGDLVLDTRGVLSGAGVHRL